MKKGFTLIEMIAVVGIIGLMSIIVMPNIINQISGKKKELSDVTAEIIFKSAESYMDNNITKYPKKSMNVYCIKLQTLINEGYLESMVGDLEINKDLDTSRLVRTIVNEYGDYSDFKILEKNESCD